MAGPGRSSFDAVIIGAGPAGLSAAVRLAHFGLRVCLLESHSRVGGLNSWYHAGGLEISAGLHAFTNLGPDGRPDRALAKLLRQLRLKAADLDLHPQRRSRIAFPGRDLFFDNNPETLRSRVASVFPSGADGFDRLRARVLETDEGSFVHRPAPARAVVESHVRDPLLADMLFCPIMFYGNPGGVGDGLDSPGRPPDMDWLQFCVIWKCMYESGLSCPGRGMRALWETLSERFAADGGDLRLRSRVGRLDARNGRVRAVVLESGEELEAETVLSSAGRFETLRLCSDRPVPATDEFPGPISIVEACAGLARPADEIGMADTIVFYSLTDRLDFRRPDGLANRSNGVVCALSNYDFPPGRRAPQLLKMSWLANYRRWRELDGEAYPAAKRRTADEMALALDGFGVALAKGRGREGKFGLFDDVFTPLTLERYAGRLEGAIYGTPVKSRDGRIGYENLFLAGADQGFHGIVGAMLSGVAMANLHVLAKGRREPGGF